MEYEPFDFPDGETRSLASDEYFIFFTHFQQFTDPGSSNSGNYQLSAVLTHQGRSSSSGHYLAWVRYRKDDWLKLDDDKVSVVKEEDVLKLSGGGVCVCGVCVCVCVREREREREMSPKYALYLLWCKLGLLSNTTTTTCVHPGLPPECHMTRSFI